MEFKKTDLCSNTLFHYTTLENARKIMEERKVKTGNDVFCFFTESEEKARELFFKLMGQGTEYIGDDLTVHERKYCDPQGNVILKMTVKNDHQFYRFICEAEGFNPYEYSVLHLGELKFESVEILPILQKGTERTVSDIDFEAKGLHKKGTYKNGLKRMAAAGALAAILTMNTFPVFAAPAESWLDSGKYDISWYSASQNGFNITTAAQLAGVSYLANTNENLTGKSFNIMNDIDLTAYEWVTIPESFSGVIDGLHKVFLKTYQTPFVEDVSDISDVLVSYSVPVGGIEDGKTYCSAVDVTGSKDSIAKAEINGTEVTVTDGRFTVLPADGEQEIVVTDKAGLAVTYTITVNDGHTWGEVYDDAMHWQECSVCQATKDKAAHSFDSELDSACNGCGFTRTVSYTITEGTERTVTKGSPAVFISNAPFDKFLKVQIDGKDVEDTNYTVVSGSTRVTLKADYTNGLAEGEHTLTIVSDDGEASTVFTVNAESAGSGDKEDPDDKKDPDDKVDSGDKTGSGDKADSGDKTGSGDKADSGDKTGSGDKADSGDKTGSDKKANADGTIGPKDKGNPNTDVNAPKTGDSSHMVLWVVLLFISGAGIVAVFAQNSPIARLAARKMSAGHFCRMPGSLKKRNFFLRR